MKNKKLITNLLFAAVVLAIAAGLFALRSTYGSKGRLCAQLIYGDSNTTVDYPL